MKHVLSLIVLQVLFCQSAFAARCPYRNVSGYISATVAANGVATTTGSVRESIFCSLLEFTPKADLDLIHRDHVTYFDDTVIISEDDGSGSINQTVKLVPNNDFQGFERISAAIAVERWGNLMTILNKTCLKLTTPQLNDAWRPDITENAYQAELRKLENDFALLTVNNWFFDEKFAKLLLSELSVINPKNKCSLINQLGISPDGVVDSDAIEAILNIMTHQKEQYWDRNRRLEFIKGARTLKLLKNYYSLVMTVSKYQAYDLILSMYTLYGSTLQQGNYGQVDAIFEGALRQILRKADPQGQGTVSVKQLSKLLATEEFKLAKLTQELAQQEERRVKKSGKRAK